MRFNVERENMAASSVLCLVCHKEDRTPAGYSKRCFSQSRQEKHPKKKSSIRAARTSSKLDSFARVHGLLRFAQGEWPPGSRPAQALSDSRAGIDRESLRSGLTESPAFAEGWPDELVGFRVIGDPHLLAVPLQLSLKPQRQHAQRYPFGERTGHAEIRASRVAAFAGADPVAIVPGRPSHEFAREVIVPHLLHRQQTRVFAIRAGGDETL